MANYTGYQGAGNSSEHAAVYPAGGNTSPGARVRALLPPGHPFHRLPPDHPIWRILGQRLGAGGVHRPGYGGKQFTFPHLGGGQVGPPTLLGPPDTTGGDTFSPPSLEGGPVPAGGGITPPNPGPGPDYTPVDGQPPFGGGFTAGVAQPHTRSPFDDLGPRTDLSGYGTSGFLPPEQTAAPGGGVDDIRERLLRQFRGTVQPRYGLDALRSYAQKHMAQRAQAMPKRPTPILPQRTARKIPY